MKFTVTEISVKDDQYMKYYIIGTKGLFIIYDLVLDVMARILPIRINLEDISHDVKLDINFGSAILFLYVQYKKLCQ